MSKPLIDRIVDSVVEHLSEKAKYEMYLSIREDKNYDLTSVDGNTNDPQKMVHAIVWDYTYSKVWTAAKLGDSVELEKVFLTSN